MCDLQVPCARVDGVFSVIFVQILRTGTRQQAVDVFSLAENLKWRFVLRK